MTALNITEFFKENKKTGSDRKIIFLEMYKNEKVFTLNSGQKIVFKYEKSVYEKISGLIPNDKKTFNSIVIKDKNNKPYKIDSIKKSEEFGGGKGSGAGAENTKLNESSVCLWCAVYQEYGKADLPTVVKHYKDVKQYYDVDETDENMIKQTDEAWLSHYEKCAEFIVNGLVKPGKMEYHRGSDLVDTINKKFKEVNKKMEVPFADINKWSPADIWICKVGFKIDIEWCQTIDCLNRDLLNYLKDRVLVGISLKKVTSAHAHQTNFNVGEKRTPMEWDGFRVKSEKQTSNIFSSKDVYIYGKGEDDISMQVRSFDDCKGYQGELIGKSAKYGKIAHGPINMTLKDVGLETLPEQTIIATIAKAKDIRMIKELYNTFSKYAEPGLSQQNFITTVQSEDTSADWLFSKYLGVKLIDILMSTTEKNRNSFVRGAVGYALSNTKNSAPFIKIS